jgi:hypothetical protein
MGGKEAPEITLVKALGPAGGGGGTGAGSVGELKTWVAFPAEPLFKVEAEAGKSELGAG